MHKAALDEMVVLLIYRLSAAAAVESNSESNSKRNNTVRDTLDKLKETEECEW